MEVLDITYDNLSCIEAVDSVIDLALQKDVKTSVFFLNVFCLYTAQVDDEYQSILNNADLLLSDGVGLQFATRVFGGKMEANCNGTDLSPKIMEQAARKGLSLFFLGSKKGIAHQAAINMRCRIPGLIIAGTHHGYFDDDGPVLQMINNSKADILFVAMGVPLQEKWITRNRKKLLPGVCIGVGALLDYLSGHVMRAPSFMRKIRCEWFWRVLINPRRMFKRYFITGTKLILLILKKRLLKNKYIRQ